MPCHNGEPYLEQAIDSILRQSFQDFEFIIVDDGSTDATARLIQERMAADSRIVYLGQERNLGIVAALNRGIAAAKGEWIVRMDHDDISEPERLEAQVNYMREHPYCIVCGSNLRLIDEHSRIIGTRRYESSDRRIKRRLLHANPFAHPATIIRKSVLREQGLPYSEAFPRNEDYDLWFRLADHGLFANLDACLLRYRLSRRSVRDRHCREMLQNTIRLKESHGQRLDLYARGILGMEKLLLLLPPNWLLSLFHWKMRI